MDLSSFGILKKNIAVIYVKVLVNVNMTFESLPLQECWQVMLLVMSVHLSVHLCVCPSVCLSVQAITFEPLHIELHFW